MATKGPTKIMIIRHAEKPGIYNKVLYNGINAVGDQDPDSLVTMGWERTGGIASLFLPIDGNFKSKHLATPDFIYASNPLPSSTSYKTELNGNMVKNETSQRPYQTISALSAKLQIPTKNLNTSFVAGNYQDMAADVLSKSGIVLIAWQHQDILPKTLGWPDCIMYELFWQTNTVARPNPIPPSFNVPSMPWPPDRYDVVFVLNLSSTGTITDFHQVPQMLLYGDIDGPL